MSEAAPAVAVVTGASSGIGAKVARLLSDHGWQVAGLDLHPSSWTAGRSVDVTDPVSVRDAVAEVEARLGPVEASVSAAGVYEIVPVSDITAERWHRMLRVHLGGARNLALAVLPGMLERGRGSIVAVTSELAIGGGDGEAHYAAAKGAVIGLVRSLAAEVAGRGVRVNAVAPGPTDTPMLPVDSPWRDPDYLASLPLRRLVSPEEVALTVAFLTEEASYCTGEVVSPNAGAVIWVAAGGRLEGRRALVTGAGQGIGRAIATRLAAEGATVAVNDLRADERVTSLVTEIDGVAAPADVSDPVAVAAMVAEVGDLDVLVVNHAHMSMGPFENSDEDEWWRVVDTNLGGTFHLVQAVLPGMRRAGFGRIVVVSSEWGVVGWPEATAYSASKAGLVSLVKSLGRELAPEGIVVNAVAPGVVDTPQLEVDAASAGVDRATMVERYAADIPLGRVGLPEEVAATVALLTDPRMAALVGQVVQVNGGSTRTRA